jgi:hypothetical protein
MTIAIEVAKISGEFRCKPWGTQLEGDTSGEVQTSAKVTLVELLDNTISYARRTREQLLEEISKQKP